MEILERILLATDFSKSNDNVIESAIGLSKTFKSKVVLLHVLPGDISNQKAKELLDEVATKHLKKLNKTLVKAGVKTDDPILEHGNHLDRIIRTSVRINANMILIGAGEKQKNDVFRLGTTAEKVIEMSYKPVLVIRNDYKQDLFNILCPIDFSDESKRALKNAIVMARRYNAKLTIFNVYNVAYTGSLKYKINWGEQNEDIRAEHIKEFDFFLEDLNLNDLNWSKEIKRGDPAKEILKAITKHKADLLVMGTTGRSGLSKFFMGSVTEKVIREVPCTFITMKSEDIIELKIETKIKDIESHFATAKQLMKDGFYEESIDQFKICLTINDMHIPSLKGISKVHKKAGNMEKAKKYKTLAKNIMTRIWNTKIEEEVRKHRM